MSIDALLDEPAIICENHSAAIKQQANKDSRQQTQCELLSSSEKGWGHHPSRRIFELQ